MLGDDLLVFGLLGNRRFIGLVFERGVQHAFVAPAQNGKGAVAGHLGDAFAVVKIVFEFFAVRFFARNHLRVHFGFAPQLVAQLPNQFGIFGKLLHQNGARSVQRGFDIGHLLADKRRGKGFGVVFRLSKNAVCQILQTVFAGDLRFGAAFGLVGQVQIFQRGFVVRRFNRALQLGRELALLVYAF